MTNFFLIYLFNTSVLTIENCHSQYFVSTFKYHEGGWWFQQWVCGGNVMRVVVLCFLGVNFVSIVQVVALGSGYVLVLMVDVLSSFVGVNFVVIVVLAVLGSVYFLMVKSCFL